MRVIPRDFYERDTLKVARDLLGKLLIVPQRPDQPLDSPDAGPVSGRIVETEAYHGTDPAAHCARGETPRCAIMFGEPGVAYVYFIYGMYEMLNFVTERKGYPGAVLIRAIEPVAGEAVMRERRFGATRKAAPSKSLELTNGPGRLCRALGIRMSHNGESLQGPSLHVADDGFEVRDESVRVSPRVGISVARDRYWRMFIAGNPFVSKSPQNVDALSLAAARRKLGPGLWAAPKSGGRRG